MTDLQAAMDRVRRYLDTRDSMPHLDSKEIHGVDSAASDHETVSLLTSDLRVLLDAASKARKMATGFRRMAAEIDGDDWLSEAARQSALAAAAKFEPRVSTLTGQPCGHPSDHVCIECGTDDEIASAARRVPCGRPDEHCGLFGGSARCGGCTS